MPKFTKKRTKILTKPEPEEQLAETVTGTVEEETLDVDVSVNENESAVVAAPNYGSVSAEESRTSATVTTSENLFRQLNPEQRNRRRSPVGSLNPDAPIQITMLNEVSAAIRIGKYSVADTLGLNVPVLVVGGVYVVPGVVAAVLVDRGHAAITG